VGQREKFNEASTDHYGEEKNCPRTRGRNQRVKKPTQERKMVTAGGETSEKGLSQMPSSLGERTWLRGSGGHAGQVHAGKFSSAKDRGHAGHICMLHTSSSRLCCLHWTCVNIILNSFKFHLPSLLHGFPVDILHSKEYIAVCIII
jgi:hypothetical protein